MQTAATGYDLVLDPAAYAGIDLVAEDNIPMDSLWHQWCMILLIEATSYFCRDRPDYWVGGNNFVYFNPDQARNRDYRGPDYFFIKDGVDRKRRRDFWAVWRENGRRPDVVIELLSPTTEQEDRTTKFNVYEQTLRVPEYFLYNHDTELLEGWRLIGSSYVPLTADERGWLWSAELGLWLGTWIGEYREVSETWLRLYTTEGELVPTENEAVKQLGIQANLLADQANLRAGQANLLADQANLRADQAEKEIARLRALLPPQPIRIKLSRNPRGWRR